MSSSAKSVAFGVIVGAFLASVVLLSIRDQPAAPSGRALMAVQTPRWHGVLPDDRCADPDSLDFAQQLPMVRNAHYGAHVFALGKNGSVFHKYQTGPVNKSELAAVNVPMSEWLALTPATYKNTSGIVQPLIFGNDPAVALNADGRIELFVAFKPDVYDLWQMYQTDAKDPLAWSTIRAGYCDPAFADCRKCLAQPECKANFWSDGYTWTTSQQALWLNPVDQKLRLTFRNFDGMMYEHIQTAPSKSDHWNVNTISYPVME